VKNFALLAKAGGLFRADEGNPLKGKRLPDLLGMLWQFGCEMNR
jgi:hypothetical protein